MLNVFIPKEAAEDETRVAATPETVAGMVKMGLTVFVESGAGVAAGLLDDRYTKSGATVAANARELYEKAGLILKINPPEERKDLSAHEADLAGKETVFVSFLYPALNSDVVAKLAANGVSAFAMDMVPRISRAQKMDALSSQSNIAGYKAVIMGAEGLDKIFPLMMTAAGTIKPARVVILGAGVAGLQAIATAKRLGALVEVSDIRPVVKEQVESLGGRFIDIPTPEDSEDAGGYAKDLGEDFLKKQREILTEHISHADVVVTTALIPGKPAPRLLLEDMVKAMRPGAVVVDLAAVMGGNCELTEPGRTVVKHDVKIIGEKNVPGLVPFDSSEMYSRNVLAVVKHIVKEGAFDLDFEDEITAGSFVTHDGHIRLGPDAEAPPEPEAPPEAPPEPPPGDTEPSEAAKDTEEANDNDAPEKQGEEA